MNSIAKTVGVDLSKHVFSICELTGSGRVVARQDLRRAQFACYLAQLPAGTVVAMEACSGAHHWARSCERHGLVPKLIAAQLVKPFRKSQLNKNDRNDAEAIATAARQGNMRFVTVKTVEQQARLSWHRVREGYKAQALAASNCLRGLLSEFGIVVAQTDAALNRALHEQSVLSALPQMMQELVREHQEHWQGLRQRVAEYERRIAAHARLDVRCVRVQGAVGVGPLSADAAVASVGDAREFANGRQFAAWLGLVPMQHSSGGKQRLGSISRRGDSYLRTLLIQGARSSWQQARRVPPDKATAEQLWIKQLCQRMSFGKVVVAIANKHARQMWAMLARGEDYDADAWLRHPMAQRPASNKAVSARM
jgi:transposase